jgi:hypothetical protein
LKLVVGLAAVLGLLNLWLLLFIYLFILDENCLNT